MGIYAQVTTNIPALPRIYAHTTGLKNLGLFEGPLFEESAFRHVLRLYSEYKEAFNTPDRHTIACVWGFNPKDELGTKPQRIVDVATWSDIKNWRKGNPTIGWGNFAEDNYVESGSVTCSDFLIACAIEEQHRRLTQSKNHYIQGFAPELPPEILDKNFMTYTMGGI